MKARRRATADKHAGRPEAHALSVGEPLDAIFTFDGIWGEIKRAQENKDQERQIEGRKSARDLRKTGTFSDHGAFYCLSPN